MTRDTFETFDVQGVRYATFTDENDASTPPWFADASLSPLADSARERISQLINIEHDQHVSELGANRATRTLRLEPPAAFPQRPGSLDALLGPALAELPQQFDAFQLRIQGPVGATHAPVLVYLPGGGFVSGSGNARWFAGPRLAADVVVVTVNYRVGALGHLTITEANLTDAAHAGNRGLRDVLLALHWVHSNIAVFGGDPEQVTLAGDSAGGWIARCAATMPETAGLFRRLLVLSAPGTPPLTQLQQKQRLQAFVNSPALIGVSLAEATAEQLLDAQQDVQLAVRGDGVPFSPVTESGWLTESALEPEGFASHSVVDEVLLLTTANEARAFLVAAPDHAFGSEQITGLLSTATADPVRAAQFLGDDAAATGAHALTHKQEFGDALTLAQFRLPTLDLAVQAATHGKHAWVGRLSLMSGMPELGSPHCLLVPLLFGNPTQWSDAPMLQGIPATSFEAAQHALQRLVLGFVAEGEPRIGDDIAPRVTADALWNIEISATGATSALAADSDLRRSPAESTSP